MTDGLPNGRRHVLPDLQAWPSPCPSPGLTSRTWEPRKAVCVGHGAVPSGPVADCGTVVRSVPDKRDSARHSTRGSSGHCLSQPPGGIW
jgi:hypothetical protein